MHGVTVMLSLSSLQTSTSFKHVKGRNCEHTNRKEVVIAIDFCWYVDWRASACVKHSCLGKMPKQNELMDKAEDVADQVCKTRRYLVPRGFTLLFERPEKRQCFSCVSLASTYTIDNVWDLAYLWCGATTFDIWIHILAKIRFYKFQNFII